MADVSALRLDPMPPADATGAVCVAFSGGVDSSVLLHALAAMPQMRARGLHAVHVHHGLHADADAWGAHCRQVCDALGVPLRIVRVQVARDRGDGPESAARRARHAAFAEALDAGDVLALAHHRDDQAETFLLRALRASGVDGLGAMRAWRQFGNGWLWRPLLSTSRAQLLAYARAHDLHWIEDPSNENADLDRNFLRLRVLPLLRERWPQADAAFARSAALSAEAAGLLDADDAAALAGLRGIDPCVLPMAGLKAFPSARRARVLRAWIDACGLPPLSAQGVAVIDSELLDAAPDRAARFAWQGAVIYAWRCALHADIQRTPLPQTWRVAWDGRAPLALPDGGALRLEGASGFDAPLMAHARQGGERIVLPGRTHHHALKHVLQDLDVPPWLRERLPLLSDAGGNLLAAGDVAYSAAFDVWLREHDSHLVWNQVGDML